MARIIFLLGLLGVATAVTTPKCRDENNKPVDWFAAYKLPVASKSNPPPATDWAQRDTGVGLVFQTSNAPGQWRALPGMINMTEKANPMWNTLKAIYDADDKNDLLWALYSDQPPPTRKAPYGSAHAKGMISFNTVGGIWFIHSIPLWPRRPNVEGEYSYPSSGFKNAQTILCMSVKIDQLDKIAKQLWVDNVHVYDKHAHAKIMKDKVYVEELLVAEMEELKTNIVEIETNNKFKFTTFAKSRKWKKELYADLVAPHLGTDMRVEAWRNGVGNLPSNCTLPNTVENINSISFDAPAELTYNVSFQTQKDHGKWAVSTDEAKPWACIGDINRQNGQLKRGGGTVCQSDAQVWKSFDFLIGQVEQCA